MQGQRLSQDSTAISRGGTSQLGEWSFRQEYLCEFVQTRENVFSYDLVIGAISVDVKPLFEEDKI
jgi:hypothetical protein